MRTSIPDRLSRRCYKPRGEVGQLLSSVEILIDLKAQQAALWILTTKNVPDSLVRGMFKNVVS